MVVAEKQVFTRVLQTYMSPCGEPITLDVCVRENRPCVKCMPAAQAAASLVTKGGSEAEIREWLANRFDDRWVRPIDVGSSPSIGPADAKVVMIEFADYECPHCADRAPQVHALLGEPEFQNKIRFVFKNFPLPQHRNAEAAAVASLAAQNQGKFWQMHDLLFQHQESLGPAEIEGLAKQLGLDLDRFRKDIAAPTDQARVTADRDLGTRLGIEGTPSFFVNGRHVLSSGRGDFVDQLRDWLRLEFVLVGAPR